MRRLRGSHWRVQSGDWRETFFAIVCRKRSNSFALVARLQHVERVANRSGRCERQLLRPRPISTRRSQSWCERCETFAPTDCACCHRGARTLAKTLGVHFELGFASPIPSAVRREQARLHAAAETRASSRGASPLTRDLILFTSGPVRHSLACPCWGKGNYGPSQHFTKSFSVIYQGS